MNQLEAMRIYVRVAEVGSFTQAAADLGLPKASASNAVQRLESLIGTRLLQRTTRRVQMTPDGQIFYERSKDILADLDDLQGQFRQGPTDLRGRLRIDLPSGLARHVIVPRLPEFLAAHPGIEIEVSSTDRLVDLVREGFDCVLRIGPLADSSLVARPLGHLPQASYASADYLARHGTPQTLADLAGHRLIHYAPTLGGPGAGFEYLDPVSRAPRSLAMAGRITVNNSDAYEAACLAGLGIIQGPRLGLQPQVEAGLLVEILPGYPIQPLPVNLLYANRRHLPQRLQACMAWLETVLQPLLGPAVKACVVAPLTVDAE